MGTDLAALTPSGAASARRDAWLDRWVALIGERSVGKRVLELGCGSGQDTLTLAEAGFDVISIDLDPMACERARVRAPRAKILCQDFRQFLAGDTANYGAVIASLSLHYFRWGETVVLVNRVRSALAVGGVLLCRLNSTEDHNYGASGYPEIEPGYYMVDSSPKRFFDEGSIDRLFSSGWRELSRQHVVTDRYERLKALWETVLERDRN